MPSYQSSEPTSRPDYIEPGDYTVEVINAEETISKSRNDMIDLKLKVEPCGVILYDCLVFTPSAFWKIDAFRAATGETVRPNEEVEIMADELIGRRGRVRLVVEEYNGRKRNKVAAWLLPVRDAKPPSKPQSTKEEPDDDNIPF